MSGKNAERFSRSNFSAGVDRIDQIKILAAHFRRNCPINSSHDQPVAHARRPDILNRFRLARTPDSRVTARLLTITCPGWSAEVNTHQNLLALWESRAATETAHAESIRRGKAWAKIFFDAAAYTHWLSQSPNATPNWNWRAEPLTNASGRRRQPADPLKSNGPQEFRSHPDETTALPFRRPRR